MARTKKAGLDYFPLDTHFFSDPKIDNLIRRYGLNGSDMLLRLYCNIYQSRGYYMIFDVDTLDYIKFQTDTDESKIFDILNYLSERKLLIFKRLNDDADKPDQDPFTLADLPLLITGSSVQKQYQESVKRMRVKQGVDANIWLLNLDETNPKVIEFNNYLRYPDFAPLNNSVYQCYVDQKSTRNNSEDCGIMLSNDAIMQNNDTKCSKSEHNDVICTRKEKKRKEKKLKEKKINKSKSKGAASAASSSVSGKADKRSKNNNWKEISDINDKMIFGSFENVYLKGKEIDKLKIEFPDMWEDIIETLSSYKAASGKGYKSDYAAIRSWVIKRVREDRSRSLPKQKPQQQDDLLMRVARGEINLDGG